MVKPVPVLWLNYNPEAIARGYWDDALMEDLFSEAIWRVPGAPLFEHWRTEPGDPWPDAEDVVVVIPGRHNAHFFEKINAALVRYKSVLFVFTGDEEALYPWDRISHPHRKVWAMGATSAKSRGVDRPLGSGYPPWFRDACKSEAKIKGGGLFLSAQNTHDRRHECFAALEWIKDIQDRGDWFTDPIIINQTPGFTQGLSHSEYGMEMGAAIIAPCPAGPVSPDSFRLYEALEAGAIPIADGCLPGYWEYVFGGPVPFPELVDWSDLATAAELILERPDWHMARVSAWWQLWKRKLAYALVNDVRELSGKAPSYETPSDLITVVMPTCPVPSHPDTTMIEEVVRSIREQLPEAEIIIPCDGMRPSFADREADYDLFLRRLAWLCEHEWHNVVPVILNEWGHQSGGTRAGLELVTTPILLFVEHDTPLTGEIDWEGLCEVLLDRDADMVRLLHQTDIHHDHRGMMLDDIPEHGDILDEETGSWQLSAEERVRVQRFGSRDVPLIRTTQWSQRPHLTTTAFYRDRVMPNFAVSDRTYIEWVMHSAAQNGIEHGMEQQWDKWRLCIYAPEGNMQRSMHLDGRAGASTADSVAAFEEIKRRRGEL